MNKNIIKDSDYINPGYEFLYGKVHLDRVMRLKQNLYVMLLICLFLEFIGVYVIPNPQNTTMAWFWDIIYTTIGIFSATFTLFLVIRLEKIYRTKRICFYGIELTTYRIIIFIFLGISLVPTAQKIAYIYLNDLKFYFFMFILLVIIISLILGVLSIYKNKNSRTINYGKKLSTIGVFLGAVIFSITNIFGVLGQIDLKVIMVFSTCLICIPILFMSFIPMAMQNIYVMWKYKEAIDLVAFYTKVGEIES